MVYTHAIAGSPEAARFLTPDSPGSAPDFVVSILELKLQTYLQFNQSFPGFGGFLPWFTSSTVEISPVWNWVNQVPGLDNGWVATRRKQGPSWSDWANEGPRELLWAVYGCIEALESTNSPRYIQLAHQWQNWLDYAKSNAAKVEESPSVDSAFECRV